MLERFKKGDLISLAGAVLLFIALFMPWYGLDVGEITGGDPVLGALADRLSDVTANAFDAFDFIDIVLLLIALGAAGLIVASSIGKLDESLVRFVEPLGGLAAVLILIRMIFQPGGEGVGLKYGIFVGLIAALAIAAGQRLKARLDV